MLYPHFAQRQTTTHITGQELPSPGEIKIPGPYRPHEHHCSCKTHLQLCPIDPKIFLFWKVFWFLLQTECHGSSSFKPNTTHLNWCKGGGKEKVFFQVQLETATHSENCWGMEHASPEICTVCTLPYPTPISNGDHCILLFYLFNSAFISAF